MKDMQTWMHSGVLEKYVHGGLTAIERTEVETLAMQYPEVSQAVDLLKRANVENVLEKASHKDVQLFLASEILLDYIHGNLDEEARLDVELTAFLHATVREELRALQSLDEALVKLASKSPAEKSKQHFLQFLKDEANSQHEWKTIHPPLLHSKSMATDYEAWVSRDGMVPPAEYENLFLLPIDATQEALTLLVWVKKFIEEEVHLDSIENFFVLQGSCKIDVEGKIYELVAGQAMFIPKFKRHTVYVTSEIPCKLIVQQIAA